MYSRTILCQDALRTLNICAADAEPLANDFALTERIYNAWYEMALAREWVWWSNTDATTEEIPDAIYWPLVMVLVGEIATPYAREVPVRATEGGTGTIPVNVWGLREIKRHVQQQSSGLPNEADYY